MAALEKVESLSLGSLFYIRLIMNDVIRFVLTFPPAKDLF